MQFYLELVCHLHSKNKFRKTNINNKHTLNIKHKIINTRTASCESVSDVKKANAALKYGSVNFSLVLEHNSRHIQYLSGL